MTSRAAGAVEQIGGLARRLRWKEKCDDISSLCDADVFFAVDHWAPEARFYRDFHSESSVWLDRDRMGGCAGLGLRERRPAAGVCHGWTGAVLPPVWGDDRGRSFLPKLRAAAVGGATNEALPETQASVVNPLRREAHGELRGSAEIHATRTTLSELLRSSVGRASTSLQLLRQVAVGHSTWSREKFACANGIPYPSLRNAKDGAPVKARILARGMGDCGGVC